MADRTLLERKLNVSKQLVRQLTSVEAPLLAAYWEWGQERDHWVFYLVPISTKTESELVRAASEIMITPPYRTVFSLSDVFVDASQIERARAIGAYLRSAEDLGRQFDTTFTGGQYFESVIVLYVSPELKKAHHAA